MSEKQPPAGHRQRPSSEQFRGFIAANWAPRPAGATPVAPVAPYAAARRSALSARFPGERLVVPAGGLKVRSNDCDYGFRPHTAFAYLTGLGADREPDAVLVLEPSATGGHDAILYVVPMAPRESEEFFGSARHGEFWVGVRPTLADIENELELTARPLEELADAVRKDVGVVRIRVLRDADRELTDELDAVRGAAQETDEAAEADEQVAADEELAQFLSTMRMVKDEYEVDQMRAAVAATKVGFDAVVAQLAEAVNRGRGERWVEGVFSLHARHQGNGVGYGSICAAGDHATTLHWVKNTGEVHGGELLLLDAGVEVDALYTADVTRTLPVDGKFTEVQRRVYEAVLAAQEAGIAAVKPGSRFSDIHAAAIRVIAEHVHAWGLLPEGVDVETTLDKEQGDYHRRWMVHGTSHHLGLDVHDCQRARREDYMEGELKPGMVLTVEPGLYFKADDLLVPEEMRGIGVRIEDDILVTEYGCENLSASLPRTVEDVQTWIRNARVER